MCTLAGREIWGRSSTIRRQVPAKKQPTLCANRNVRRKQKKRTACSGKGVTVLRSQQQATMGNDNIKLTSKSGSGGSGSTWAATVAVAARCSEMQQDAAGVR